MSDEVKLAIIGAIVSIVTVFLNYKISKLEKRVDGRLTELLESTKKQKLAEGNLAGKAEGKLEERKEVKERKEEKRRK